MNLEVTWSWNNISDALLEKRIWLAKKLYKIKLNSQKEKINASQLDKTLYIRDLSTAIRMLSNLEAQEHAIPLIDGHLVTTIARRAKETSTLYIGTYIRLLEADSRFFVVFKRI